MILNHSEGLIAPLIMQYVQSVDLMVRKCFSPASHSLLSHLFCFDIVDQVDAPFYETDADAIHVVATIESRSFLRHQVRNMIGSLVCVAKEKMTVEQLEETLQSKDRSMIPLRAPAHGLYLYDVYY